MLHNATAHSVIVMPLWGSSTWYEEIKEVRCSFHEFSKPIRFCSNLVEKFFNPFPIRKCKKIGGHHVGFQDGADQSSLDYTRNFAQVFSINSAGWKAMNFWVCSNIWANTIIVPEMILRAYFALAIVLQVKIANTIFGCLGQNGHTWANLGQMYLYDFYKIFTKCLYGYIIWKNAKKTGGHHVG